VELQKIVQFLGVSHANMQMGHMRFEPNINMKIIDDGTEYRTPICEVKNLNSFRALEGAVAYEQWRHLEEWKKNRDFTVEKQGKQNLGWDEGKMQTVFQRGKEEAHDYRYFPDPDLVPVVIAAAWLAEIQSDMGELPLAMKQRFVDDYGLSDYDAGVLTGDRESACYFDEAVKAGGSAKRVANLISQQGLKIANERDCRISEIGISTGQITDLAKLIDEGTINASAGVTVFEKMLEDGRDPNIIAEENNLIQVSDTGELENMVDETIAANEKAVAEFQAGGKKAGKARGFLLGQVMQKTKGQANPKIVGDLLDKKLK
jgi:aspartyl-tRNA(Asn)/glutamyl-tRNA(Gln) amidotransferase subunit B